MNGQVILLRGINVGGHGKLPMADLRALLDRLGAGGAVTHLQSGNALCPLAVDAQELAEAINADHGFRPAILSLSADDWQTRAATNPFPIDPPKAVHGFFHDGAPLSTTDMMPHLSSTEGLHPAAGVTWLHTPDGFARSKIASRLERLAGRPVTARNWNSVAAITAKLSTLQNR